MYILYFLRVAIVSVEAIVLAGIWLTLYCCKKEFDTLATTLLLKEAVLNYLWLMPIGLAVWIFREIRQLIQEDLETVRILTGWEDYWKLKVHTWLSLGYAVLFALMSLIPWVVYSGIETGTGLLLFIASILGQLCLAISVYVARIRVKEIIAQAKAP